MLVLLRRPGECRVENMLALIVVISSTMQGLPGVACFNTLKPATPVRHFSSQDRLSNHRIRLPLVNFRCHIIFTNLLYIHVFRNFNKFLILAFSGPHQLCNALLVTLQFIGLTTAGLDMLEHAIKLSLSKSVHKRKPTNQSKQQNNCETSQAR
ncbi:hypothetical protein EG68_10248 [Paragonimus skrjabini miyazakii]|uniref:Uncharacterized protein n=1 Tax=Paragonimus skrjabini miyazakii TaxID=59628 RepID=A0A8S9YGJ0_9TREM|nr:hypothetical protein EG68_10248 [Paragonimus skrjabini miyazakii]